MIRQRHPDNPLSQMVLYVGLPEWHPRAGIAERALSFHYEVVDIRTIDCQQLMASPALEENILAILCRMDHQKETIRELVHRIAELPEKSRADALTKLLILSRLRRLETLVNMETSTMALTFNLMENDVLRPMILEALRDSEQKGLQKGMQNGIQQGIQQGEQQGMAGMLIHMLQRRFGAIPARVEEKIAHAKASSLETWGLRLMEAGSLEEIFLDQ
ncbi:MAG: DUF4351 domain-containing protein [Magnetococcales bacterium]|nr:DUF4351 domain-containing protein [Magnetococcales bacterium]MBF0149142.1 DUF4351 domain-containing protein [Magnetococcales bacterium]